MNNIQEQLNYLRGMTVRFDVLHEAQVNQLKMWPMLLPNVKSSEANVDIETKTVTFNCKTIKGQSTEKEELNKMLKAICGWTQSILWPETRVLVYFGKKKVIDSNTL